MTRFYWLVRCYILTLHVPVFQLFKTPVFPDIFFHPKSTSESVSSNSHIDYILLSHTLVNYNMGMQIPLISV